MFKKCSEEHTMAIQRPSGGDRAAGGQASARVQSNARSPGEITGSKIRGEEKREKK